MFRQLGGSEVDWDTVLERMQLRRAELMQEKGLPAEKDVRAPARRASTHARSVAARDVRDSAEARPQAAAKRSDESGSEKE